MSRVTEITALFTKLASYLQIPKSSTSHAEALLPAISSLNQSLNLNEESSRVRVLDAALSLMCFKAPQVFESVIECLVETIISVLSSSVCCKVCHFGNDEFLTIGSSICFSDCRDLFEAFSDILGKLDEYGVLSQPLLYAVSRVAVSSSCYWGSFPCTTISYNGSAHQKNTSISKFHVLLPEGISVDNRETPLRLFFWYLDPITLKHDVSEILREHVNRPFLLLKNELHERTTWHSVMICLVLAPTMFIETRTLLHKWFLLTGLASVQDLEIELVSSLLDALAQPMRWGFSMEVGSKLPFSHAYFRNNYRLLATLAGPISHKDFLSLDHLIRGLGSSSVEENSYPVFMETLKKERMTNQKSTWSMLMAFPKWFLFATVLLFSGQNCLDIFLSECMPYAIKTETTHDDMEVQYCDAAARYLAQILSPRSKAYSELLVDCLIRLSKSYNLMGCSSDTQHDASICTTKLRKFRLLDIERENIANREYDYQDIRLWLKEFNECHLRYLNETNVDCMLSGANSQKQILLFRRIPLGIFIGYSYVDEKGCELLLHYASTGAILQSMRTQNVESRHIIQKSKGNDDDDNLKMSSKESDEREDAIAGTCLIFNLFDTIEEMIASIFRTEESSLNYFCQLKTKAVGFLVKCIRKLLQLNTDEDKCEILMLTDLYKRLIRWRHQGQEDFKGCNTLDEITRALNCKISSYK